MFGATAEGAVSAGAPCPALHRDDDVEAQVAEKESRDDAKVAELAATGVKPIRTVYADGGQNPVFAGYKDTSDPESLVGGPQEIALSDAAKPAPAVVRVAGADAARQRAAAVAQAATPARAPDDDAKPQTVAVASTTMSEQPGVWGSSTQNVKKWLHLGGQDQAAQPTVTAYVPDQPIPTDVPLPPRRDEKSLHVALKDSAAAVEAGRDFASLGRRSGRFAACGGSCTRRSRSGASVAGPPRLQRELSSTLPDFARLFQTAAQKIDASATRRTACSTGDAVRPEGPNGARRSFRNDQ